MAPSRVSRTSLVRRVRRVVLGHRRLLAALLSAVAVLAGLQAVRPDPPPGPVPTAVARTLGERLLADHPGLTPLPVRLPDAEMAALLEPGDTVTLLATPATGESTAAQVVASGVTILQTVPESSQNRVTGAAGGRLIIVGVTRTQASSVTAAAVRSVLTYAWDR
ncbi:hypothetical protein [Nocardioides sp.]|uniref:hypothetical protein n=1 Tax=Nocardioides sp. TaxID=35761 RepID=UPI0026137EC8|nr:hypothetical protein [Nocardioides sp.]